MARKVKILALHSWRTSSEIFRTQLTRSGIFDALEDAVEITFVQAPHPASGPAPDDVSPYFKAPYFEWWNLTTTEDGELLADGIEKSFEWVGEAIREHGPFDGIMGFSQGGAMASMVVGMQRAGRMYQDVPRFKFAVIFAGVRIFGLANEAFEALPGLPSIHLLGDKDPIRRRSLLLIKSYSRPIVIYHSRGHVVPRLPAAEMDKLRSFIVEHGLADNTKEISPESKI